MKPVLLLSVIASLLIHAPEAGAKEPFKKQPAMSTAYNKLNAALTQVEKSKGKEPVKHRNEALLHLKQAKIALEEAKKNKGSSRPAAIKLIDEATKELEATPPDEKHTTQALDLIRKAIHEVVDGAKAAN